MTLWHRAPREVYRVYGEDEYLEADELRSGGGVTAGSDPLAGSDSGAGSDPGEGREALGASEARASPDARRQEAWGLSPDERARGSRSGRLVGLGLLVGVTVGALSLILLDASRGTHPVAPRGVSPGTRSLGSRHSSLGALAGPAEVVHAPAPRISAPRAHALSLRFNAVRRGGHPWALDGGTVSASPTASVELWQPRPFVSASPESPSTVPGVDEEFGFER
jgi:hypothetical protein